MSNRTWVCFDCREAVRRGFGHEGVRCAFCGRPCRCLGYRIPTPRKAAAKQWAALRRSLNGQNRAAAEDRFRRRVRRRHALEARLVRLDALPPNPGRAAAIRRLRRTLSGRAAPSGV